MPIPKLHPGGRSLSLWLAFLIVLGLGAFFTVRQVRINAQRANRLTQLAAENSEMRARLEQLSRENRDLRQSQPTPAEPPTGREEASSRGSPRRETLSGVPEESESVRQMRDGLAAANASITQLQARILELDAEVQKATEENKRLTGSQGELTEKLADAGRAMEALQREAKAKDDRLSQLELARKRLEEESAFYSKKTSETAKLSAELQEIYRRREVYLRNILSRYKDVTEQYRALSAVAESRRDREGASPGAADLSRIQNTIALAEEDLRQLDSLNAQAVRVQKKFSGK